MREAIERLAIPHAASAVTEHITVSIGGITTSGAVHGQPHELISLADEQLYKAKQTGRNRVCWDSHSWLSE